MEAWSSPPDRAEDIAEDSPAVARVAARLRAGGCVFAEDEARILIAAATAQAGPVSAGGADGADSAAAILAAMTDRRAAGMPLEHVVGWAEFCGLRIAVDPGVFVPRRRTEFLVSQAAAAAQGRPALVVVDLCCGSGALGMALAATLRRLASPVNRAEQAHEAGSADEAGSAEAAGAIELYAADSDPAAVACARRNVVPAGGWVYEGDLFAALPDWLRGRVDVLLANVPYVPSGEMALLPAEAREHEPQAALDGGPDGLDVLRRVLAEAPAWLVPGGAVLSEVSHRQSAAALGAAADAGLSALLASDPGLGATVLIAVKAADPAPSDR